jgi:hypothetical protein
MIVVSGLRFFGPPYALLTLPFPLSLQTFSPVFKYGGPQAQLAAVGRVSCGCCHPGQRLAPLHYEI